MLHGTRKPGKVSSAAPRDCILAPGESAIFREPGNKFCAKVVLLSCPRDPQSHLAAGVNVQAPSQRVLHQALRRQPRL